MRKSIVLKSLELKNFKGIKDLKVNFGAAANVYGGNGTGKSSNFDAFTWLLFDKDSGDRKKFEIKTLDKNNQVLHGLDHMVTGVLSVNGRDIKLSKLHREKWTKSRGEASRTLTGNETLYYVDDLPVKQSEYMDKVNSIIDENIFKLITNPLYFSTGMKWTDRRNVLLEIIGNIPDTAVISQKSTLKSLEALIFDKDIDTVKKSLAVRKKKLNEEIKTIPHRIDELNKSIQEADFEVAQLNLKEYSSCLTEVENKLTKSNEAYERFLKDKNKLCDLKNELISLEINAKNQGQKPLIKLYKVLADKEKEINSLESTINKVEFQIADKEDKAANIKKHMQELRDNYYEIKRETPGISPESYVCPSCGAKFVPEAIERKFQDTLESFESKKKKRLEAIDALGNTEKHRCEALLQEAEALKANAELLNKSLSDLKLQGADIKNKIDSFSPELMIYGSAEYIKLKSEIAERSGKLSEAGFAAEEIGELEQQRAVLKKAIEECQKLLVINNQNERFRERINEWMKKEKEMAQLIADLEGQELLCEEFIKTKVELLESRINSKFKYVRFKLFNLLINGTVEECCEALIDGVPFSSANKAGQINGGLDIINTLCGHYGVSAPIFIDNRESVNRIIPCSSQVINLIVSSDVEIRVENTAQNQDMNSAGMEVTADRSSAEVSDEVEKTPVLAAAADGPSF